MSGFAQLIAVVLLATGLTGCTLLDLLLGGPAPFDPTATFPVPTAEAVLSTGTATIKLANETLVLDELAGEGVVDAEFGTSVTWTNGTGWYLSYFAYDDEGFGGNSSYLSIDRIVGVEHWVIYDPTRCITTADPASATPGVKGTALCRGLEWSNYFSQSFGAGEPEEIPGQPAFDADITFEAR